VATATLGFTELCLKASDIYMQARSRMQSIIIEIIPEIVLLFTSSICLNYIAISTALPLETLSKLMSEKCLFGLTFVIPLSLRISS